LIRLVLAMALGGAVLAASVPCAQACGMESFWMPRKSAPALVADALRDVERGREGAAIFLSRAVLRHPRASSGEKAKAWAIIAWANWQRGDQEAARPLVARSRALDSAAVETVLIHARDTKAAGAMRDALKRWA
jgi:hypothetical protein